MWKYALISKVEKWYQHLEKLLHMFPVHVIRLNPVSVTEGNEKSKVFLQLVTGSELQTMCVFFYIAMMLPVIDFN